ncbi:transcription factor bHLH123-like protein isoform X2 [Cinnamomum micranthum f. kanehirae]|uniref:Transcription factor bHLH123-like protein isoform X2 n=1 Tax=Cinnamomum micranthum f. kanehirae TaxID=337451 RepID=A0A443PP87_9MAGN|nr:transcription factor bHLH123-like protein isoform X2 [Cinnamomum micranthum f. kanehirae]
MGEEMQRSIYRGDWTSETSHLIGWSSDISLATQINDDAATACDDSMEFSEPKQIYSQLQFSELGVPSSIWGQDLLSSRSGIGLRCDNPFTAPAINNMLKQEHPFPNLESDSLVGDSPFLTQKVSAMPPLFPAMVGEGTCLSSGSKAPRMGGINNQCLVYGEDSPSSWKGSQETAGTPRSSGVLSSKKGQERSTACNAALKDSCMDMKKSTEESTPKRIRSDSHVPFTTFKVRKEKLGDRITALQQLVSPFGKTDTASVLFDAIEYIKFLHDQVTVLSTPYMMLSHKLSGTNLDVEAAKEKGGGGLRSRGLCLVPVSTTLHVAKDNTTDFWAPTFGGSFR